MKIVVALDWTEFDRATPLVWKTVKKSELRGQRNRLEDEVIEHLASALNDEVVVTLLADRGFGDQKRYAHLDALKWNYVIRFKASVHVAGPKAHGNMAPHAAGFTHRGVPDWSRTRSSPRTARRSAAWWSPTPRT